MDMKSYCTESVEESYEARQEGTIVVSSRVYAKDLATVLKWLEENEVRIRSMSSLVGECVRIASETVVFTAKNGEGEGKRLQRRTYDFHNRPLVEAIEYLRSSGMMTRGMYERNRKKLSTALRFESMRKEGWQPLQEDPTSYKILHNKNSVKPLTRNNEGDNLGLDYVYHRASESRAKRHLKATPPTSEKREVKVPELPPWVTLEWVDHPEMFSERGRKLMNVSLLEMKEEDKKFFESEVERVMKMITGYVDVDVDAESEDTTATNNNVVEDNKVVDDNVSQSV